MALKNSDSGNDNDNGNDNTNNKDSVANNAAANTTLKHPTHPNTLEQLDHSEDYGPPRPPVVRHKRRLMERENANGS